MLWIIAALSLLVPPSADAAPAVEVAGARVSLHEYDGPAEVAAESLGRRRLRISVRPGGETAPLTLLVELDESGPDHWPAEDVRVVDAAGLSISARRGGTELHKLRISVPPEATTYAVEVVDPPDSRLLPPPAPESDRDQTESQTGLRAVVCPWFAGRRSALSLRFDDSHPTHLTTVIPLLREHDLRATFMINPGAPDYQERREAWEACAETGDQEFANHTMHHRGAPDDEKAGAEIGDAAAYIVGLFPGRSPIMALNLGGGTWWSLQHPLRHFLSEHHLFLATGSLGMDDAYGDRIPAFRTHLERHVERGGWCRAHFHAIGDGLSTAEANFRAALAAVREREADLWVAGMADIHRYSVARRSTRVALGAVDAESVTITVSCQADPKLFDHPLTVELTPPPAWREDGVVVRDADAQPILTRAVGDTTQFDVDPVDATYTVTRAT